MQGLYSHHSPLLRRFWSSDRVVRKIVRDEDFLALASSDASRSDISVIQDLVDTLESVRDRCAGMAANMIGVRKNIIAICIEGFIFVMINPVIRHGKGCYSTEEGCLSLDGTRKCTRYMQIDVDYMDISFSRRHGSFSGFTAQVIQHEIDHLDGILI